MKKLISLSILILMSCSVLFAQKGDKEQWREKVRAERVAFLTEELSLTEAEAQAFWPVYNQVQEQRREAFKATAEACKALKEALENGKGNDVQALLDEYLKQKAKSNELEISSIARFKAVLPVEKVARLTLAEEQFRHRQIGRLAGGPGKGPEGDRSGQNRQPRRNEPRGVSR